MRPFSVVIVLVILAAAVAIYYAARWPIFYPSHIVVTGTRIVSREEVLQRAALDPGRNIWLQNVGAAAARVAEIPYVRTVQIRRRLPADVTIAIAERKPFASVTDGTAHVVVDDELRILDVNASIADLPQLRATIADARVGRRLSAPHLGQLVRDGKALLHAGLPIAYLSVDRLGDLNARLRSGILVEFGDDGDIAAKARLVNPVLVQVSQDRRKVRALDLRAPKTPVLIFAN